MPPNEVPERGPDLLIVAASARALAQSAVKSGLRVAVIDAFGDRDTRECSVSVSRVPLTAQGLQPDCLQRAFLRNLARFGATLKGWVVGPGLENCRGLFAGFARQLALLGNEADIFRRCSGEAVSPPAAACALPRVPRCDSLPALSKSQAASGGAHIRRGAGVDDGGGGERRYRQTYLPGAGVSHLFVADGKTAVTLGFSTQWHSRHCRDRPFAYGGAVNRCALPGALRAWADARAQALTGALGLRGINNVDYLYCAGRLYFLELNPRPGATMALYDADYPRGLLHTHLQACRGLLAPPHPASAVRACAVIYSAADIVLAPDFNWPGEARDVPSSGGVFRAGEALCSLVAEGRETAPTLSRLQVSIRGLTERLAGLKRPQAAAMEGVAA